MKRGINPSQDISLNMTSYIISAAPSQGKSYFGTLKAIDLLRKGHVVFSNYPIIYSFPYTIKERLINMYRWITRKSLIPKHQVSSLKWFDEYIDLGIHDCTIILDEAYKVVNCHNKLSPSQHDFFATTGHNNVDIYVIAQNYRRINVIIREMSIFIIISKFSNPLSLLSSKGRKQLTPLFFTAETYLSERDYQLKGIKPDIMYERKRYLFNKSIGIAYDTQYYRMKAKTFKTISWLEDMTNNKNNDTMDLILNKKEEKMKEEFILD